MLHGDLKPSNVMLSEQGVRLFDFGLGQTLEGVLPGLPQLSRENFKAWTPNYAAPELLEGGPFSMATDVYAVACVLFEMASGKHPFQRLNALEARDKKLNRQLKKPKQLPKICWPALHTALAFNPKKRTMNAAALRDSFRAAPPAKAWLWF